MVARLLRRFGDIMGSIVAAILQLVLTIVIGPIILLLIGTDAALSIARREPRTTLPSSGVDLGATDGGHVDLTHVADAIASRCKIDVTTVRRAPDAIELSSDMTVGPPLSASSLTSTARTVSRCPSACGGSMASKGTTRGAAMSPSPSSRHTSTTASRAEWSRGTLAGSCGSMTPGSGGAYARKANRRSIKLGSAISRVGPRAPRKERSGSLSCGPRSLTSRRTPAP